MKTAVINQRIGIYNHSGGISAPSLVLAGDDYVPTSIVDEQLNEDEPDQNPRRAAGNDDDGEQEFPAGSLAWHLARLLSEYREVWCARNEGPAPLRHNAKSMPPLLHSPRSPYS